MIILGIYYSSSSSISNNKSTSDFVEYVFREILVRRASLQDIVILTFEGH